MKLPLMFGLKRTESAPLLHYVEARHVSIMLWRRGVTSNSRCRGKISAGWEVRERQFVADGGGGAPEARAGDHRVIAAAN